jgi:hypothetical protein
MVENKVLAKIKTGHTCPPDSALKCVDCNERVCPKCFVQCAVGNRCKKCTDRFTSHVLIVNPKILLKLGSASVVVGLIWGYVAMRLNFGMISYFLTFFAAVFLGRLLHRVASYKIGWRPMAVALTGLIIGLALGPYRHDLLMALQMSQSGQLAEYAEIASARLADDLINIAIFLVGALVPFVRKN